MSFGADLERARLSVALDIRHPGAYLALCPTIALGRAMSIEVDWLPLAVPPLKSPSRPGADDDRGLRHRRFRAEAIAREIETYAAAQGLVMRGYYRNGDPGAAHLGWLFMRDRHPAQLESYLLESFRAYWSEELDASSTTEVAALVESCSGKAAAFEEWAATEGSDALAALAEDLGAHGLHQVPAYVVEGEVFYGRQHLPMIEWILDGRPGRGPI